MAIINLRISSPLSVVPAMLVLSTVIGCYESEQQTIDPVDVNHALHKFDSCDAYADYAKQAAIHNTTVQIEYAKQELERWWSGDDFDAIDEDSSAGDDDDDGDADDGGSDNGDSSDTNVQEQGVDEADMIKTDGRLLYTLSEGNLVIVEATDAGELAVLSRVEVGGWPKELFLYKGKVAVFSNVTEGDVPESMRLKRPDWFDGSNGGAEPGQDDSDGVRPGGAYTQLALIDVSEPATPVIIRTVQYAGSYVSSRRIDNTIRAVLGTQIPMFDLPQWPEFDESLDGLPEEMAKAAMKSAYDDLLEKNIERINSLTIDDILPLKIDSSAAGATQPIAQCGNIYGPSTPSGPGLLTVVTLDLDAPQEDKTDIAVVANQGLVYASKNALYLTSDTRYVWWAWSIGLWNEESSGIHKFDIKTDPNEAIYVGTGTVQGHLLNQFCLGEHEGYLRVATTTGNAWDPTTLENHLFVLGPRGDGLEVVGRIDGLGLGEEVYAARFLGDRGFMVTFYETDPLYTFDLSDPHNPKVVGEWHGPGFSTYLHPLGDNHLITVGKDGNRELALSLYDLTNFAVPTLVERQPLAVWQSPALSDHKAFTFDAKRNLLALPYIDWDEDGSTGSFLLHVDTTAINLLGRLRLAVFDGNDMYDESPAKRTAFMGENLYSVSRCRITSAALAAPAIALHSTPLFAGDHCQDYDYYYYW